MSSIIRRRRGLTSAIWGSPVSGVGCTPPDPGRREITHRQIRSSHLEGGLVQYAVKPRQNLIPAITDSLRVVLSTIHNVVRKLRAPDRPSAFTDAKGRR